MSDKPIGETPESPDYFAVPTKDEGTQQISKKVKVLGVLFVALVLIGLFYTFYVRSLEPQHANAADAENKVVKVALPPVKKPPGPDVNIPSPPVEMMHVSADGTPMPGMGMSEEEREARAKQLASIEAAMNADSAISQFSMNQTGQQNAMYPVDGTMPPQNTGQGSRQVPGDPNMQDRKRAFLNVDEDGSPYLKHTRTVPLSQTEIKAGSIIPGVMISGVNSDLPGQIIGQVRQNVYDSATGRYLLIPAGARLVGTYDSSVAAGQERVLVAWNRVIYPDGSSLSLDGMPGADQSGFAGYKDQVDNHYWRTFGNAFMLSLFSAGIQLSQPRGAVQGTYNAQQIMAADIGRQLGMLGMQMARRNLNIQPTLEIRPGFQFSIMITKDIILPPWTGHPLQARN